MAHNCRVEIKCLWFRLCFPVRNTCHYQLYVMAPSAQCSLETTFQLINVNGLAGLEH